MQRALLRTAQEVAKGMDYIHSCDIIHGDLKACLADTHPHGSFARTCPRSRGVCHRAAAQDKGVICRQAAARPLTCTALEDDHLCLLQQWSPCIMSAARKIWCSRGFAQQAWGQLEHGLRCCCPWQAGNVLLKTHRIDRRGYIAKVADFGAPHPACSVPWLYCRLSALQTCLIPSPAARSGQAPLTVHERPFAHVQQPWAASLGLYAQVCAACSVAVCCCRRQASRQLAQAVSGR